MTVDADRFERIVTAIPGPRSLALQSTIARYEAPGVTFLSADYPVFWAHARDALVTDVDGNRYIDLTAAFGVANIGHTNPRVAAAVAEQAHELIHGMGDVHPTEMRARLLERLAALAPGGLRKTYLTTGGAEAVEFALKTALLATGRSRFIAYRGSYHGLSVGTLGVIGIAKFREPFVALTADRTTFLPFPARRDDLAAALGAARAALDADPEVAAFVLEPIQGRGGVIVPPDGFLRGLRALCDTRGVLLIFDEIYTGFGRTGSMFACEREGVVPDLLCVGKALGGGVPIGATIGTAAVMDAWPKSTGEALHTATFLGNPLACAAALAALDELERLDLCTRVARGSASFAAALERFGRFASVVDIRGIGYLWALEFRSAAVANRVVVDALARGVLLLQSGATGTSITLAPPLVIGADQLARALDLTAAAIEAADAGTALDAAAGAADSWAAVDAAR
jgi:4-aminobutyrate aminotransferase/(S)-3-amino-2-methylpropionate transaminase